MASLNAACDRLTGLCSNKDKILLESAQQITRLEGELTDLNAVGLQKDEEVNRIKGRWIKRFNNTQLQSIN